MIQEEAGHLIQNDFRIHFNYMNNNETKSKCCQCFAQAMIIIAFLSLFFTIYSLDQSLINIGSLNKNITNLTNQDTLSLSCLQVCPYAYSQVFSQSYCCVDSTNLTTCKTKEECKLEIISNYQNELNTQYLYLFVQSGAASLIVISFAVYCIKKRMKRARAGQAEQSQIDRQDGQNIHAPLFNYVGSLVVRREFQPANLQSSFLFEQSQHVCSICLESLVQAKAIRLNCNHIFHSQCIKSWMQSKNTCPICRTRN